MNRSILAGLLLSGWLLFSQTGSVERVKVHGKSRSAGPQVNMAVAKRFDINERYELEFRGESFNTANTPILSGPNTDFRNPLFGALPIQQLNIPRQIQLGLRLKF